MPIIGPGPDGPENDHWDPAWEDHDTPFRRWLYETLTAAGLESAAAADAAGLYAPANRYNGLDDINTGIIAALTGAGPAAVRAAHKADLAEWAREQQLRDHPPTWPFSTQTSTASSTAPDLKSAERPLCQTSRRDAG